MSNPPDTDRMVHVRRRGRITNAQTRALELYSSYEIVDGVDVDLSFDRRARVAVEIGFGMGHALAAFAANHADWNCIGIDVYQPGIGSLIHQCESSELTNVKISDREALSFLQTMKDSSVDIVMVFFPDPWPKKRHHKRRLVNPEFAEVVARKLKQGGKLYIATDWDEYAEWIDEALTGRDDLLGGRSKRPDFRPVTRFEQRGERLGHDVADFCFERA